jgi:hypothetical protein
MKEYRGQYSINSIFLIAEKEFPEIKHSFDVWHGANNFGKMMI